MNRTGEANNVFVNRTLNLKRIKYIGFDMDHTLIRYNGEKFEALAHKAMLDKLVQLRGYPESILKLQFDYDRSIRGLVLDKIHGNVLKLSRHGAIRGSYHGLSRIDYETQKHIYTSKYVDLSDPDYDTVDTSFSIAFAGLFGQLVQVKDDSEPKALPDYATIAKDLSFVLDRAHRDGSLKSVIASNLDDFIIKDQAVVEGLERFVKHDKKVFVLTNSDFHYTKLLLDYAITPFLKEHKSWQDLFELVITSAQKPRFFYDDLKFLKIDPTDGSMTNLSGPLTPGIYQGGCASTFTNDLNLQGDDILYVGDHIYGDIVRLKKDCAWRTALVVEELEDEIASTQKAAPIGNKINKLMSEKIPLEVELDQLIGDKIENGHTENEEAIKKKMDQITKLDQEIAPLIKSQQQLFNYYWGEVMRVGIEESYFAYQVERFACIYMARLSDLLACSPRRYFRSFKRLMAHEAQLEAIQSGSGAEARD